MGKDNLEKRVSEVPMPLFQKLTRAVWLQGEEKTKALLEAHKGRPYYDNLTEVAYVLSEIKQKIKGGK